MAPTSRSSSAATGSSISLVVALAADWRSTAQKWRNSFMRAAHTLSATRETFLQRWRRNGETCLNTLVEALPQRLLGQAGCLPARIRADGQVRMIAAGHPLSSTRT